MRFRELWRPVLGVILAACSPNILPPTKQEADNELNPPVPTAEVVDGKPTNTPLPPPSPTTIPTTERVVATETPDPGENIFEVDIVQGETLSIGGENELIENLSGENVDISLRKILDNPENNNFLLENKIRLVATEGENYVVRNFYNKNGELTATFLPTVSPDMGFISREVENISIPNLAASKVVEETSEVVYFIPLTSVEDLMVNQGGEEGIIQAQAILVEIWDEESMSYIPLQILVDPETGEILDGTEMDKVQRANTIFLPILDSNIELPFAFLSPSGQLEIWKQEEGPEGGIVLALDVENSRYILSHTYNSIENFISEPNNWFDELLLQDNIESVGFTSKTLPLTFIFSVNEDWMGDWQFGIRGEEAEERIMNKILYTLYERGRVNDKDLVFEDVDTFIAELNKRGGPEALHDEEFQNFVNNLTQSGDPITITDAMPFDIKEGTYRYYNQLEIQRIVVYGTSQTDNQFSQNSDNGFFLRYQQGDDDPSDIDLPYYDWAYDPDNKTIYLIKQFPEWQIETFELFGYQIIDTMNPMDTLLSTPISEWNKVQKRTSGGRITYGVHGRKNRVIAGAGVSMQYQIENEDGALEWVYPISYSISSLSPTD